MDWQKEKVSDRDWQKEKLSDIDCRQRKCQIWTAQRKVWTEMGKKLNEHTEKEVDWDREMDVNVGCRQKSSHIWIAGRQEVRYGLREERESDMDFW
jgi:hypothetical protein